jgi:hypothetical protein
MQFVQPDDHDANDHTVFQVTLPQPIAPGASVTFHMTFHDQLPKVVERTGYAHDFDMVGQWFPKVGVWWKNAWNCHQFHATTEFFADFGTFDVKITLPQNEIVGAGGDLVSSVNNPDGSKTLAYHSEDVHDFSWTASPSFTVVEDSWTGSHPTLITAGTAWWMPNGLLAPEVVTEHEFGHQYWYGMVATNEFEEAWLDEGINSYTEVKVMDALYGKDTSAINFPFAHLGETQLQRVSYLGDPDMDPISRFAWKFIDSNSYGGITYGKTATMLIVLEKVIGQDTLRNALHTYFMRYRFTHPTGEDFLKTVEEVSGKDLRWYFNQSVYGTNVLDSDTGKDKDEVYRTYVTVQRKGDFVFPVDLLVKFDDDSTATEHWDGQDRWVRYQYDRKAKIKSAQIDPQNQIIMDRDLFNNSYAKKSDSYAVYKLRNMWVFASEWLSQLLAWLT